MKKEMFNDRYGLTNAVLNRMKTNTRRLIKGDYEKVTAYNVLYDRCFIAEIKDGRPVEIKPRYEIGEVVAVAQSYENIYLSLPSDERHYFSLRVSAVHQTGDLFSIAGWTNKMFVSANLMPNRIRITDIKVERLQDISEEDCIKEGVQCLDTPDGKKYVAGGFNVPARDRKLLIEGKAKLAGDRSFDSGREAFAYLIDHISGKGTWERNPWVFAYEFELIKN